MCITYLNFKIVLTKANDTNIFYLLSYGEVKYMNTEGQRTSTNGITIHCGGLGIIVNSIILFENL